jgi:hypothetical protein
MNGRTIGIMSLCARKEGGKMRHFTVAASLVCMAILGMAAAPHSTSSAQVATEPRQPRVQIALLLDTSNSMDGLIDQAKSQLWKIVNEFIAAERDGRRPTLEVALYEYGNDNLSAEGGYVRRVLPLTSDLDRVSQELFALTTNGGSEYCGTVIACAGEELNWVSSADDLKTIFIAGNEPFTQGSMAYAEACRMAASKGITVNTIFCGPYAEGATTGWQDGAARADGTYMNIDQNQEVAHIIAPQDEEIAELGERLNATYVPFGLQGEESEALQAEQDKKAGGIGWGALVQRSVTKASPHYRNDRWDLVDAVREGTIELETLKNEELPEEMQSMTQSEKEAYVHDQASKREEIQARVLELNEQRKAYVAEEMKKQAESGEDTFDAAVIKVIRQQAEAKSFTFEQ